MMRFFRTRGERHHARTSVLPAAAAVVLSAVLAVTPAEAAFSVKGSVFEQAGREFNVDPLLLYSVAVVESAVMSPEKKGFITPSPWTLRTSRPFYASSREEAERELMRQLRVRRSIDVGMMQINTQWHGHRVKHPLELLDPLTNVRVGAQILSELIARYPRDAAKAIGNYHSYEPFRSAWYARNVLRVYANLKERENRK